jgi:hypothetical protein
MGSFRKSRCTHYVNGVRCELAASHSGMCSAMMNGTLIHWFDEREKEEGNFLPPLSGRIEKVTGPIYSWRWWKLTQRGKLRSVAASTEWDGPVMTTKLAPNGQACQVAKENPVTHGGYYLNDFTDYGVYSYKTPRILYADNQEIFDALTRDEGTGTDVLVLGKIENHGHVVEHTEGYRSQKVLIVKLYAFYANEEFRFHTGWLRRTERNYQCEVEPMHADKFYSFIRYYTKEEEAADAEDPTQAF